MKYAHLSDLHLGSWREPKMRDLSTKAFLTAIDSCIQEEMDFVLFSGDIFNTSLPSLDTLKIVTKKLKELKDRNIPLYVIAGSHDFSPSGKTMIDVLEHAGLLHNVCRGNVDPETKKLHLKFTIDSKTQAKITGILGRKGLLDKMYYQNLHLENLETEPGYKIFMFHTTLTELKPKHLQQMESQPVSFLPKGFNYYAGGHIHHPTRVDLPEYGPLTYPGALFPNNFAELEKYGKGGYYIITTQGSQQEVIWRPLEVIPHCNITLDCSFKTPEQITNELLSYAEKKNISGSLLTIRIFGEMSQGKTSDIDFKKVFDYCYNKGVYFIMKNTNKLTTIEFQEIKISSHHSEMIEEEIIREHLQQVKTFDPETEMQLIKSLIIALNTTKKEGETITDFQKKIEEEVEKILNL